MKILVLNTGSSSIKFKIFEAEKFMVICSGIIEKIGENSGHISFVYKDKNIQQETKISDHMDGIKLLEKLLIQSGAISSFEEFYVVGHRVVHGGEYFNEPVLLDDKVINSIEEISSLAPLHNPINLIGIKAIKKIAPNVKQVAVFDTAFHQSIPSYAYHYALPMEFYEDYKIRRYGFHGTSHHYVAKKASEMIDKDIKRCNFITLHLGNGDSATAIKSGKSIDTSMGLTPLEGLIMGTRCGDIDPAILPYISTNANLSLSEIDKILNKKSGLKGICGTNDMREIEQRVKKGDKKATLALEMFCYRIKKYIGSYMAVLGDVDAIIFTGGIGEHSALVREKSCSGLENLGIIIDKKKNSNNDTYIYHENSKAKILVIPTDEELEIAKQSFLTIKE